MTTDMPSADAGAKKGIGPNACTKTIRSARMAAGLLKRSHDRNERFIPRMGIIYYEGASRGNASKLHDHF